MRAILAVLPALACFGMVFVCGRMLLGHRGADGSQDDEVSQLRAENARLRAEHPDSDLRDTKP
jgi:hypothetical protein